MIQKRTNLKTWIVFISLVIMIVLFSMSYYKIRVTESKTGASANSFITYGDRGAMIKVFSRNVGDLKDTPVFVYGDLINRAIRYKDKNPDTDVTVKFAIYKIGQRAYIGVNPDRRSYGYVKGNEFDRADSEQLLYSVVKAALHQVHIDFIYHLGDTKDTDNMAYLNSFMDEPCLRDSSKAVKDYLRINKIGWGSESHQQMHAKFMTVSHYITEDDSEVCNSVYSTTGNIDDHDGVGAPISKDWVQSGILIGNHPEIEQSFDKYFDMIFENADNQSAFKEKVREAHAKNLLNYDDTYFSTYFFPIPKEPCGDYTYIPGNGDANPMNGDAWDINFNPIAKYVNMMASIKGPKHYEANIYHLKTDNFGKRLYNELLDTYNQGDSDLKDFRFVVKTNSYDSVFPLTNFNKFGIMKSPVATHAKNSLFAFTGAGEYFTITGSTNYKLDGNCSKANVSIVIKEYGDSHPVFDAYEAIFNYQYREK